MPLTDAACRNATCPPERKQARYADSGGLYLEVSASGSRRWFWKFRIEGVEKKFALGTYPGVGLAAARRARDVAKAQKASGINPIQARQVIKLKAAVSTGDTFHETALEWYEKHHTRWSSHYAIREKRNLEKDLFPHFAARRIGEIEPIELLAALRRVEERGALDVASRVLMTSRAVWRYAVATARAPRDITADLKGALTPHKKRHFAAITDPVELGVLLRVIGVYQGGPIVRTALQLAPMLFQRPNELRGAAWAEIDLDGGIWTVPAARMKRRIEGKENGDPHLVPLPTQAVKLLRKLQPISGHGVLVFPGERSHDRPISDNTLRAALLTLGYGPTVQTVHGFRATARTMLAEVLEVDPLVIEAQLAHAVKDANGRAYNRTQYLKQRTLMMQRWADYLDDLKASESAVTPRPVAQRQESGSAPRAANAMAETANIVAGPKTANVADPSLTNGENGPHAATSLSMKLPNSSPATRDGEGSRTGVSRDDSRQVESLPSYLSPSGPRWARIQAAKSRGVAIRKSPELGKPAQPVNESLGGFIAEMASLNQAMQDSSGPRWLANRKKAALELDPPIDPIDYNSIK